MDCTQAQEILLSAADSAVPPDELAQAELHCEGCSACARLRAGLQLLEAAAAPAAPEGLVDTVISAVREDRVQDVAHPAAHERLSLSPEPARMPARWRWSGWERRFAGFAAAAAIVVVGLVVVGLSLPHLAKAPGHAAIEKAPSRYDAPETSQYALPETRGLQYGADATAAVAAAPPYVVLDGLVYRLDADRPRPSTATTAGTVTSALDDPAAEPAAMTAYSSPSDIHLLWIETAAGKTLTFRLVTRSYAGDEFALVTDSPILRFGEWPTLPTHLTQPSSPDGSPAFRYVGFDDRGARIYAGSGSPPLDGFAVAPGTPPDDPAAGNPNWTWWSRID